MNDHQKRREEAKAALDEAVAHFRGETKAAARAETDALSEVRERFKRASDDERVDILLEFATSERDLARLVPTQPGGGEVALAPITTVTVTTVTWPSTAH